MQEVGSGSQSTTKTVHENGFAGASLTRNQHPSATWQQAPEQSLRRFEPALCPSICIQAFEQIRLPQAWLGPQPARKGRVCCFRVSLTSFAHSEAALRGLSEFREARCEGDNVLGKGIADIHQLIL